MAENTLTGDDALAQETDTEQIHAYYFMNQVIHILKIAKNIGVSYDKVKTQICLGSDFDGLINAIDCCKNATQFDSFKQLLLEVTNKKEFWRNTGLKKKDINMNDLLDRIFYQNGVDFTLKHL